MKEPREKVNIYETLFFGILLAASGGLMDAYSFLGRGGVFANAQTGNILLLGVNISRGEWSEAVRFLLPIAAFSLGIAISALSQTAITKKDVSPRTVKSLLLTAETVIFTSVAFIPADNIANALISFACGIQLEAFGTISATNVATTMCIGNLRSSINCAAAYFSGRDRSAMRRSLVYFTMIISFIVGAVIGGALIDACGRYAILGCTAIASVCALIVIFGRKK